MRAGKKLLHGTGAVCVVALALVAANVTTASTTTDPALDPAATGASRSFAPAEAIVRFEPGTTPVERREVREEAGVEYESSLDLPRTQVVEVDGSVRAAVRRLESEPGVAYAQPNYRYQALAVPEPDDTFFADLWGLEDPALPDPGVSALEAWEESKGGGEVIAVLDTGVDLTHPDLAGNLWSNLDEEGGVAGVDDDGNGRIDDLHGFDLVDDDGNPDDYEFHGTHVAGTAAALAGNGEGIAGVAPEAEIMAVRVLDGDGSGSTAEIADGIVYAAENGADVINMSLGGPAGDDQATEEAIELAGAGNAVVVVAAGNEGVNNDVEPHTPCALPQDNLICVAALTQAGALASFSNFGAGSVDIAAPGTAILSAKVDYGPPLFSDGFESGFGGIWEAEASSGGIEWGLSSLAATGTKSATDSPAAGQEYAPEAESFLFTEDPVNLDGERGCRLHFRTQYEIEPRGPEGFFDAFLAGGLTATPLSAFRLFAGKSAAFPSNFLREEVSISDLDDRIDVFPTFAVLSDASDQRDGAYVDDVRLICRDETYEDEKVPPGTPYDLPDVGNYVQFQGTSMATPHVSGVVALVRAAAPVLNAQQVVDAVLTGASAIPSPSAFRRTATEGIADACQAIAVATGANFVSECPGSSENVVPPPSIEVPPDNATPNDSAPIAAPVADRRRPQTFITRRPPRIVRTETSTAKVVFRFGSNEAGVTFVCRVDGGFLRPCARRFVRRYRVGFHMLRVMARDAAGNVDLSPAVFRFRVKRRG